MGYFPVRYDSRVVIYERKMFIRLATDVNDSKLKLGVPAFKLFYLDECFDISLINIDVGNDGR